MTNSKTTKRALFSSVVALLLCFTMLLGTTFAWFTDSAASGSNVITAGNLDIVVEYTLGDKDADGNFVWKNLDGATDLFQKGLWEPGHTEVVLLKITNNGSLALKYAANMNIVSETVGKTKDNKDIVLSEILTVSTCTQQYTDSNNNIASGADIFPAMTFNGADGADGWIGYQTTSTFKAGNVLKNDKQLQPQESDYIAVKVDMAETVGNEANHNGTDIPTINFGINVLATQFTYENDSFGNQYDKDAEYPAIVVNSFEDLVSALKMGGNIVLGSDISIGSDEYMQITSKGHQRRILIENVTVTLDLNGHNINVDGGGYTFYVNGDANLTFKDSVGTGAVISNSDDRMMGVNGNAYVTIESGVFRNTRTEVCGYNGFSTWGNSTLKIYGGTFDIPSAGNADGSGLQWLLHNYNGRSEGSTIGIEVFGGKFVNHDLSKGTAGTNYYGDKADLVNPAYQCVKTGVDENGNTWYEVVAK